MALIAGIGNAEAAPLGASEARSPQRAAALPVQRDDAQERDGARLWPPQHRLRGGLAGLRGAAPSSAIHFPDTVLTRRTEKTEKPEPKLPLRKSNHLILWRKLDHRSSRLCKTCNMYHKK